MTTGEKTLRELLWLTHGHKDLYGDDGEMQCKECGIDFKRDCVSKIKNQLLLLSQIASCTCMTKTPKVKYHDENCRYRLLYEVWRGED